MSDLLKRILLASTVALAPAAPALAQTFDLAFLPPELDVTELCREAGSAVKIETQGEDDLLTNRQRIAFLRRDIQRLTLDDADHWFDFVAQLIDRRLTVDPAYTEIDAIIEVIELHLAADRAQALQQAGLIPGLLARRDEANSGQKYRIAQYYLNGNGVAQDIGIGQSLMREAAMGGNENALFEIARMSNAGELLEPWTAPLDLTLTMALGGILGELDENVCRRAERIADEYTNGRVLTPNPELAHVWTRFAADLGSGRAAWMIVEHHLAADAAEKDNATMMTYLRKAVENGVGMDATQVAMLKSSSDISEDDLRTILGFNYSTDTGRERGTLSENFRLLVNIDGEYVDEDSPYLAYLAELTALSHVPGWVYRELGKETLSRKGRWKAEDEGRAYFEQAVALGDEESHLHLARIKMHHRDDPAEVVGAINLLEEAVARFGNMPAMHHLDEIYRCQVNDAPRMNEASYWSANYNASMHATPKISATDLMQLGQFREPEILAQIQAQALSGRSDSMAMFAQRVQVAGWAYEDVDRLWAHRLDRSDQALERYAELEFELARNAQERNISVELFRRVYLNNGVTTALDLGIALVEHDGRTQGVADEIIGLLTMAGNRGEGAAIRLMSRLLADKRSEESVYKEFAHVIEDRGDFLALMFAIPHIGEDRVDEYIDRAVSLMNCGTKDADEIGSAYAIRLDPNMSYHWRRIGLHFDHGAVLSKLRLSDSQMDYYDDGGAPDALMTEARSAAEGSDAAQYSTFHLAADADLPSYNPRLAARVFADIAGRENAADRGWILAAISNADTRVRHEITQMFSLKDYLGRLANSGEAQAGYEYAMILRDEATRATDLLESAKLLRVAANDGVIPAMREYGYVLMNGIGVRADLADAAVWLDRAAELGDTSAADHLRLLKLRTPVTQ